MATEVKRRRGTTTQHSTFTGAEGEITVDLTKDTLVVHDGSTQAGFPLLREDFSNAPAEIDVQNSTIEATEFIGDLRGAVRFIAKALGTNISKGDAVYISGISGNTPTVGLADADDVAKMPAFGLAAADINENATGEIITFGTLSGVDTSSFSVGDILYIDTSSSVGSTLTATAPAGESAQIQNIGKVQRSDATVGSIKVGGAGRSNATPNLNQDKIFLGDSNNRAVSTALSSINLSSFNDDVVSGSYLPLTGGTITGDLIVKSTDAGAAADPNVTFFRDSASPADNDVLGDLLFSGRNDAATQVTYGRIASQIADASSTTHDGKLRFQVASDAALVTPLTIEGTASTFTTSVTATSFVKTDNSGGFLKADGTEDTNTYLTSETSHADVLVDGDFTSNGLMKRTGAGTYGIVTDNSSNWDTAYSWGDHSTVGYLTAVPSEYLTETEGDARYLQISGGTLTNSLTINVGSPQLILRDSTDDDDQSILFRTNGDVDLYSITGASDVLNIKTLTSRAMKFFTNDTLAMTIDTDGSIDTEQGLDVGGTLKLESVAQDTAATSALVWAYDGSQTVKYRTLGSNAFNSDTIPTNNNQLTNGAGYITQTDGDARYLQLTGGTISSNLIISGNLTVSGTTTTVNTETIKLADNIIMLNSNFEGETPSESSGIEIERGPSNTNKQFLWNETNDRWQTDDALYVSGALTATGNVTGSNLNISNWDTAYGWGDHSTEGYLTSFDITSQTDPKYLRSDANDTFTGTYLSLNSNGFLRTDNSGYFTAQAGTSGFQFRNNANNATRVAILDGGNVGIGETNPLSKVHIEDTSGATLTLGNSQSPNDVVSGTVFGRMNFYASDRSSPTSNVTGGVARIEAISTAAYSTTSPSALLFYTHANTANDGTVLGNPTERMRIDSSGNVLIGTTTAQSGTKLQVSGQLDVWSSTNTLLRFNHDGTRGIIETFTGGNYSNTAINPNGGNVGIGTTSPASELDVEGTIQANNLKLQNLSTGSSDTTVLTLDAGQNVNVRTLGSNAFDSTSYLPLTGGTLTDSLTISSTGSAVMRITNTNASNSWIQYVGSNDDFIIRDETDSRTGLIIQGDGDVIMPSGNVGIGTDSPNHNLHVEGGSSESIINLTTTGYASGLDVIMGTDGHAAFWLRENSYIHFGTNSTERMRIDSSGRVLVGKTASNYSNEGIELRPTELLVTKDSGTALSLQRLTNDGIILSFAQGGSTVGSIGSDNGRIAINSSGNNLFLQVGGSTKMAIDTNGKVYPATHNANDLGFSTSLAWRDLYLSGDANIGTDLDVGGTATISQNVNGAYRALLLNNERTALDVLYHTEMNFQFAGTDGARIRASMSEDYTETATQSSDLLFYTRYNGTLSERLRINDDGKVGIGTTSPSEKLHISGTNSGLRIDGGTSYTNTSTITLSNGRAKIDSEIIDGTAQGDTAIKFSNRVVGTLAERMRIHSNGNVGIGTTSPDAPLTVTNNSVSSYIINVNMADDVDGGGFYESVGGMELYLKDTSGSGQVKLTSSGSSYLNGGNIGIGTTSPAFPITVTTDPLSGTANSGVAIGFDGTNHSEYGYRLKANGANYYQVLYNGSAINWKHYTGSAYVSKMSLSNSGDLNLTGDLDVGGQLTISDSVASGVPLLVLDNDSNGNGATIEFNDNSSDGQKGLLRYNHADSLSQGGGCSFHFTGEPDTVLVVGNDSNSGRFVASGNSSSEVAYGFRGDVNTGMYSDTADYVKLATGGVDRLTISSSGSIGINYNIPSSQYGVHQFLNSTDPNTDNRFAYFIDGSFSGADNTTGDREQGGIYLDIDSSADGDASNEHRLRGIWCDVRHTGFSDIVHSGYFYAESNNTTEATSQLYGIEAIATHDGGGSGGVNTLAGSASRAYADDAGSLNYVAGAINQVAALSARGANNITTVNPTWSELELGTDFSGTITNHYGVRSALDNNSTAGATITNSYLFYGDIQGTDPATNKYGIHIGSSDRKNYFAGNVGIGTTSPSSKLHINTTSSSAIRFSRSGASTYGFEIGGTSFGVYDYTNSVYRWRASGNDVIIADSGGNVGIGTTSPATELDVEGTITSNNLKLQNLTTNTSDTAVLTLDQGQNVRVRTLGSNAFDSTSYLPLTGGTLTGALTIDSSTDGKFTLRASSGDTNDWNYINFNGRDNVRDGYVGTNAGGDMVFESDKNSSSVSLLSTGIYLNDNVGIGTSSPNGIFHVYGNNSSTYITNQRSSTKWSEWHVGGTDHALMWDSSSDMRFMTTTALGGSGASEKVRILSSGGITFNGDTATANALDDYEEGTFTPTIHAGASNIVAASNNYGKYTKVGNVVHCSGRFQSTSLTPGSSSTNVEIGGLPFSAVVSGLSNGTGCIAGAIGFASGFTGEKPTAMQIRQNEPNAFLYYQNASLGFSNIKGNDFSSGANTIVFQITYHVA